MKTDPRRENGITVRYLSQTIINNTGVINSAGIDMFVESMVNYHGHKKDLFINLDFYFFFHLEDYGCIDKTEIDFILYNESVILPVEVKAFTDANSPDVKREIIRNYLYIEELKNKEIFRLKKGQKIFPVLLYSESYQNWKRGRNSNFNYFNEKFLLTKGKNQSYKLDNWGRGGYKIDRKYSEDENFINKVKMINDRLFFTTWDKIYRIHVDLNIEGIFGERIRELENLKDLKQEKQGEGINLVNSIKLKLNSKR